MSEASVPVTISILDKEYVVSCPAGEEEALRESARMLHERMSTAREGNKAVGLERLAVVTALNIVHEYLQMDSDRRAADDELRDGLTRVQRKIEASLGRRSDAEPVD
ncbi:MAG: cell division protein ZapA [Pseudomonadota bacterium]